MGHQPGAATAPIVTGLMARLDYFLLFANDALTTFIFGLIVLWGMHETRPAEAQITAKAAVREREPLLLLFCGRVLFFILVYMQDSVTLPLDMKANGAGPDQYGLVIAVNGVLIVLVNIPISTTQRRAGRVLQPWLSQLCS